jgi:hypothetical protein
MSGGTIANILVYAFTRTQSIACSLLHSLAGDLLV